MKKQSWMKVLGIGLLIGFVAALGMTMTIAALRYLFYLPSPPELIGDRLAPLFTPEKFFELLFSYGGYNQLKIAGVRGVLIGQLAVGALGGLLYALIVERARRRSTLAAGAPVRGGLSRPGAALRGGLCGRVVAHLGRDFVAGA